MDPVARIGATVTQSASLLFSLSGSAGPRLDRPGVSGRRIRAAAPPPRSSAGAGELDIYL